jgi:hypothetical protein
VWWESRWKEDAHRQSLQIGRKGRNREKPVNVETARGKGEEGPGGDEVI